MPASTWTATRLALQRVATHVLARRRHDVTGRFGLRATPGGFGTPAFGPLDEVEVLRVAGTTLVHERGPDVTTLELAGSGLADVATAVGVDLSSPLDVGHDTPSLGDVDEPLAVDPDAAAELAIWFDLGWRAIDRAVATGPATGATTLQLWPEHFDAGCSVAVGSGRANLGASPGDDHHPEPYLYVGPWGADRPGDPGYWNAPFGALLAAADVDSLATAVRFLQRGLTLLV